jgi:dTDP-4-amino-4,6-dideoxygalactose transaminase
VTASVRIPLLVPQLPTLDATSPYLRRIDENRWYSNFGPLVRELESRIAASFETSSAVNPVHAITVSNATAGLEIALRALALPAGSLVLVPALTFVASATAVLSAGLMPIVADVDQDSWLLTPTIALAALQRVPLRAVLTVATFGAPQDALAWNAFNSKTGLPLIIDAAAAYGNQIDPGPTCAVFSLHATKPLAAGEGGIVITRSKQFAATVTQLTNFGIDLSGRRGVPIGNTTLVGTNAKMSEYHAAVGLASLDAWPDTMLQRRQLFHGYQRLIDATSDGNAVWQKANVDSIRSVCCVLFPTEAERNRIEATMSLRGIATRRWYLPLINQHPAFQHLQHVLPTPVAFEIAQRLLGIPFHLSLSVSQQVEVADSLKSPIGE